MAKKKQAAVEEENEDMPVEVDRTDIISNISKSIMTVLGKPSNFQSIQVKYLWDDRYRVNVLVGPDNYSTHISNSFFIIVDENSAVKISKPLLTKCY